MASKDLPPRTEAFFPTIFYKTQFCEKHAGLPLGLTLLSKVAIVTGSNVGLGFESARQLLALNLSHLILAVRSTEKGEQAASQLRAQFPHAKIEVWKLDMCSYSSIQEFAFRVDADLTRLDIALLNAGLVKPSYTVVKETGHEETVQVVSLRIQTMMAPTRMILTSFCFRTTFRRCSWHSSSSQAYAPSDLLEDNQAD